MNRFHNAQEILGIHISLMGVWGGAVYHRHNN